MRHLSHIKRAKIRRRPCSLPFAWRIITPRHGIETHIQKRDWQLVLNARGIDFKISLFNGREHIYVPPITETIAKSELSAYMAESMGEIRHPVHYPVYPHCTLALFFLLPLILIHGLKIGWWPVPAFLPSPETWDSIGRMDAIKIMIYGQWQRLGTALSLHASLTHLTGNVIFGAFFMAFLARITGIGRALLFTLLAGIAGNAASLAFHDINYKSEGFSTALFGCIGVMAGIMMPRAPDHKKIIMPLAAGIALLAMLGTEGENTDYTAHLCGFAAGVCLGILEDLRTRLHIPGLPQWLAAMIAILIFICAWMFAISSK